MLKADLQKTFDKYKEISKSAPKKKKKQVKKDYEREILARNTYLTDIKRPKLKEVDLSPTIRQPIVNLFGWRNWRLRKKVRSMPERFVMARVFTINRAVMEFYVPANIEGFKLNKGRYIFDDTLKYWNATAKMWCYDYQEPLCIPVHIQKSLPKEILDVVEEYNESVQKGIPVEVDVESIKEVIQEAGGVDVENAVNPKVLETYLKSNFVQSLVEGASLGKIFKILIILSIIILVCVVLVMIFTGYSSGIFNELGNLVN